MSNDLWKSFCLLFAVSIPLLTGIIELPPVRVDVNVDASQDGGILLMELFSGSSSSDMTISSWWS
jgi:hypothetical protein